MIDKKTDKTSNWYLVTIDDAPRFLSGKSFIDILQVFSSTDEFNFIITDSIEGSGVDWVVSDLQNKKNIIFKFAEILNIFYKIKQLDWGDFFLFKKYPQNWSNIKGESYPLLVAQSDTTIRAVDNQYMYIYTPYQEIVELLKNTYIVEEIIIGPLDSLDFPD